MQAANLIQKVTPIYPAEAKANRVQGVVRFTVIIGKDGTVQSLTLVSGDPVLAAGCQRCSAAMGLQADVAEWRSGGSCDSSGRELHTQSIGASMQDAC